MAGVRPWLVDSPEEAERICMTAGMRLCTWDEYNLGCGAQRIPSKRHENRPYAETWAECPLPLSSPLQEPYLTGDHDLSPARASGMEDVICGINEWGRLPDWYEDKVRYGIRGRLSVAEAETTCGFIQDNWTKGINAGFRCCRSPTNIVIP